LVWARFPWLNYREVIDRILRTVDPLPSLNGRVATGGRLNVRRAVSEINTAPSIAGIADQTAVWGTPITTTASASDPENNELKFSLEGAPAGATINEWTGQFSWTPSQSQAPGNYVITVRVSDNGSPPASAATSFRVIVEEPNAAPAIAEIPDRTVTWGTAVTVTASASDPENNELRFSLEGAPAGATINESTGQFSWTPSQAQAPGNYVITVRATDNGSPTASAATSFRVIVEAPNLAPAIAGIPDRTVTWGTIVTATASASDPENNELRFSLEGAPAGATINELTGQFSWTPTQAQAPSNYVIIVRVTDNGSPPASATTTFTIIAVDHVRIANIRQTTPGEVVLTWNSASGAEYRVEYTEAPGGGWQHQSSITAQGSEVSAFDNPTGGRRFYRVVRTR
jgi:hypothetical protein